MTLGFDLSSIQKKHNCETYFETGLGYCDVEDVSLKQALKCDFKKCFSLEIDERFILNNVKGVKPRAYDLISKSLDIKGQYRTYDYMEARKSVVFLEPIRVFTDED